MGEDSRFEYIYKFVSRDAVRPGGAKGNADILITARCTSRASTRVAGSGIELTQGKNGLTAERGFASQGDVVISTGRRPDLVGATKMDRQSGDCQRREDRLRALH